MQRFLAHNFLPLIRSGILYPAVESQGFSHHLAAALEGGPPPAELPINVREAHNALAFRMLAESQKRGMPPFHQFIPASRQILVSICNQMQILQPHTTILCAEVFANFAAVDPALIERLREAFAGCDVRLMCTLRRPDEYLASWFGQELKFGRKLAPLRRGGAAAYYGGIHFDYALMLGGWIEVFGADALSLRNYADVLAAGGSIEDFKARSGIAFPPDLDPVADANPSIPRSLYEIARRGNHALGPGMARTLRERLLALAPTVALPPDREIEMFGAETRRTLVERFAPVARRLDALNGGRPFFPDLEAVGRTRPIPEPEAAAAAFAAIGPALRRKSPEFAIRAFLDRFDPAQEA